MEFHCPLGLRDDWYHSFIKVQHHLRRDAIDGLDRLRKAHMEIVQVVPYLLRRFRRLPSDSNRDFAKALLSELRKPPFTCSRLGFKALAMPMAAARVTST